MDSIATDLNISYLNLPVSASVPLLSWPGYLVPRLQTPDARPSGSTQQALVSRDEKPLANSP